MVFGIVHSPNNCHLPTHYRQERRIVSILERLIHDIQIVVLLKHMPQEYEIPRPVDLAVGLMLLINNRSILRSYEIFDVDLFDSRVPL